MEKKTTTASQLILLIQGARGGWIWDFPEKHLRDKCSCQLSVGHWAISSVMSMMTLKFHFPNPQIWNIVFYLPSGEVESFFFFSSHESTACCDSLNIYSDKPAFLFLPQSLQDAAQAISVTIKKWALLKKRIQFSLFSSSISATPKYQIVFKGKVTIYLGQGVNGEQERRKSSSNTESIVSNQLFNQSHHHYIFSGVHAWVGGKAS